MIEPASNAATWQDTIEFINDETGAAWFPTGSPPSAVTMRLRDRETGQIVLTGSLGTELSVISDGVIQFTFSADAMGALDNKPYDIGILYTAAGVTTQAWLDTVSILEGL